MYLLEEEVKLAEIQSILDSHLSIGLPNSRKEKVLECRDFLDSIISKSEKPVYGVNTGFGSLYNKYINSSDLEKLQENLVKSHATGVGPEIPAEIVAHGRKDEAIRESGIAVAHRRTERQPKYNPTY